MYMDVYIYMDVCGCTWMYMIGPMSISDDSLSLDGWSVETPKGDETWPKSCRSHAGRT
jgi:hypothetical protein